MSVSIIDRLEAELMRVELAAYTNEEQAAHLDALVSGDYTSLPSCGCGATAAIPGAGYSGDAGGVLTDTCKRCGHCHTIRIDGEYWHTPPGTTWADIARLAERGEL